MSRWIGVSDHDGQNLALKGDDDRLLTRGSLVIETAMPSAKGAVPLVYFDRGGERPFHMSLQAVPDGGLVLVLDQGNGILHQAVNTSGIGRCDTLRITYSWESTRGYGMLSVEQLDQAHVHQVPLRAPGPMRAGDLHALLSHGPCRYLAPEVSYVAASTGIEPVGPMPTLTLNTPIATPGGYRPAGSLNCGDLVLTSDGQSVPVLHRLTREVPARGLFRPMNLRAPYFGLQQDITVAPTQRLVLDGSDVEYMFSREAVLIEVRHLLGGMAVTAADCGALITYTQLLLPHHEAVVAAGTVAETLYIGRLRRRRDALSNSILVGLDRHRLPEHGQSLYPVLNPFDAVTLANARAA